MTCQCSSLYNIRILPSGAATARPGDQDPASSEVESVVIFHISYLPFQQEVRKYRFSGKIL